LKREQLEYEAFKTKEAAKQSLLDYMAFYNSRSHSTCGYQSPLHFERDYLKNVAGQVSGFS